jgi:hypothetical protein
MGIKFSNVYKLILKLDPLYKDVLVIIYLTTFYIMGIVYVKSTMINKKMC